MRGLLLRLSNLDPDVGASLRVIEYFDRLVKNGASLDALTRASAALGCCTAGLRDQESGRVIRFDGNGQPSPALIHPVVTEAPVVIDDAVVGHVWLEREAREPLDEMLVERMAVTAAARWKPFDRAERADPALVELSIASATTDEDRARALRLLGMSPTQPLRAVAVSSTGPTELAGLVRAVVSATSETSGVARACTLGMPAVVLTQTRSDVTALLAALPESTEAGVRIGVGLLVPSASAPTSWATARVAARFASAWRYKGRVVGYEDLGALAALADVPRELALANRDVSALASLAGSDNGEHDIETLLALAWHGSARQAAQELHLHHSSVTNRLRHVEAALGLSLDDPGGRLRAQVAALLWRLSS